MDKETTGGGFFDKERGPHEPRRVPGMDFSSMESVSAFRQLIRNGRWGSCGLCPRDAEGRPYPEACVNTRRDDHQFGQPEFTSELEKWIELYLFAERRCQEAESQRGPGPVCVDE
jgi:hypothetical protein